MYIQEHCIKIAKMLYLDEEDWKIIYLLFTCINYTKLKKIDSRVTEAINAMYSTIHSKRKRKVPDDLKLYKIMIYYEQFIFLFVHNYIKNVIDLLCFDKNNKTEFSIGMCLFKSRDVLDETIEELFDMPESYFYSLCMKKYNENEQYITVDEDTIDPVNLVITRYRTNWKCKEKYIIKNLNL